MGALFAALLWSAGAVAQVVSSATDPVVGHAPVVTIEVVNETAAGETPRAGQLLRAAITAQDPDGDTITGTTVRWLRGTTELGTNPTYTLVPADSGETLTVEATATTDPAITDPSSGTGTLEIAVADNSAPVASNVTVEGDVVVGASLTGKYTYTDPDGDTQGATTYQWYRATDAAGETRTPIDGATSETYTIVAGDVGSFLVFEVTPVALSDTAQAGDPVRAVTAMILSAVTATANEAPQTLVVGETGYGFSPLTEVAGGTSPYTYAVVDGDLPDGLSLDEDTGVVSGTPDAEHATQEVTFAVRDAADRVSATTSTVAFTVNGHAPVATNVVLSGIPMVGETLKVEYDYDDIDGDLEGDTEFQWCWVDYGCGSGAGFNQQTYTLRAVDALWTIYARVTPKSRTGMPQTGVTVESNRLFTNALLKATADQTAQVLTVGQSGYLFVPLTAVSGGTGEYTYEVQAGDSLPAGLVLDAAKGEVTGTPEQAQAASDVTFLVKDKNSGAVAATTSTVTFTVHAALAATAVSTPQVLVVGQENYSFEPFTAVSGGTGEYVYEVEAGDSLPAGLTLAEATGVVSGIPETQQAATDVTFRVKDKHNGVYAATESTVSFTVQGRAPEATNVAITGDVLVGETLEGTYTYADADNDPAATAAYQWYRTTDPTGATGRALIADATAATYKVANADQGHYLVFEVTPKSLGGDPDTGAPASAITSAAVAATAPVANEVSITGTLATGETLIGSYEYFDAEGDEEDVSDYQWYRAADAEETTQRTPIDGATGLTYQVVAADQGRHLVFEVTPKAKGGDPTTGEPARAVTATPVAGNAPVALNVAIDGLAMVGVTLEGTYAYDDDDEDPEGETAFQWYRSDDAAGEQRTAIDGATDATYTVVAADEGKFLVFEVTPKSQTGDPDTGLPVRVVTAAAVLPAVSATAVTTPQVLTVNQLDYEFSPFSDVSGGVPPYRYELQTGSSLSAGLVLDADSGVVSGKPTATRGATDVSFQVKDANGTVASTISTVKFTVNSMITASAGSHPATRTFTVGQSVGAEVMGVSGGTKPWVCEIYAGELPAGLEVVATGTTCRVVGTTTEQQVAKSASTQVRDDNGVYATFKRAVSYAVTGAAPVVSELRITGDLTVGSTVTGSYVYTDADGDLEGDSLIEWCRWGKEPCTQVGRHGTGDPLRYTVQDGDVDAGFHFRVTPRSVAGTNPIQGTRVTSGKDTYPVTRIAATADTTPQVLTVGQLDYGFTPLTNVKDGKTPYHYEVINGTLPEGLQIDAESGEVSGTPGKQQSATPVTFRVRDDNNVVAATTAVVSFTVHGRAPVASNVRFTGNAVVGQALTAEYDYADADEDPEGASAYQWYRSDNASGTPRTAIDGAATDTYTLVAADQGKFLVFEVTPAAQSGTPATGDPAIGVTAAVEGNAPVASDVRIEGVPAVGEELAGKYAYDDSDGDPQGASAYQWYRADDAEATREPISGATSDTYTVVAADLGKVLFFEVTPRSQGGTPDTGEPASAATATSVIGRAPVASNVAVTGTPAVGQVLTATYTYDDADADPEDTAATQFRWYRADDASGTNAVLVDGPGNTLRTRTVVLADVGKYLRVGVEPVSQGGTPDTGAIALAATWVLVENAPPQATDVGIDGTPAVGVELEGTYTYGDPEGDPEGISAFQWYRASDAAGENRTEIGGATNATYTVVAADMDQYLVFEVTPKASSGAPTGDAVRAVTATVVSGHAPVASNVTVTGTPRTGQQLTITYDYSDADDDAEDEAGTLFRWYRADDADGGNAVVVAGPANNLRTRTVQVADVGKYLRAGVEPASLAGDPSKGANALAADWVLVESAPPTLALVKINNIKSPVEGQTLIATASGYADPDGDPAGTHLFQWYRGGEPIPGATDSQYRLVAADVGARITAGVVPKATRGNPDTGEEVLSAPTETVVASPTIRVTQSGSTYSYSTSFNFNDWSDTNGTTYLVTTSDQAATVTGPLGSSGDKTTPYTTLTVTATSGAQVKLRAHRDQVGCTTFMNSVAKCSAYNQARFKVWYAATDNLDLAEGTHAASFELEARVHPTGTTDTPFRIKVDMEIVSGGPLSATADTTPQTLTVGQAGYRFIPLTASGGVGAYTYEVESGSLPGGLGLSATTGEVSGVPNAQQEAQEVVFRVKDTTSTVATTRSAVTFKVNAPLTATANTTPQVLTVGQADYSFTPLTNVAGGEGPYTYVVSEGALPQGLVLDEDTGEVSGVPEQQQATETVVFRVQDANDSYAETTSAVAFTVNGGAPVASAVSIEGQPGEGDFVGDVLTGRYTYTDADNDPELGTTFQWYRSDSATGTPRTEIAGATDVTYTVVAADQGKYLVFEVTPKSETGDPDTGDAASAVTGGAVIGTAPVATGVAITGTPAAGELLTGTYTYTDADDDDEGGSAYQWYRTDDATGATGRSRIDGAIEQTYTPVAADQGKYLVFEVTPKSQSGDPDTGLPASATTATAVQGTAPVASAVSITGTLAVGQVVTGQYSYFDADGDAESGSGYRWFRADDAAGTNPDEIENATAKTYTIVADDVGKHLVFEVTPKSVAGTPNVGLPVRGTTASAVPGRVPVASNLKINGDRFVGNTVTVSYTYSDPDGDPEGDTFIEWCRWGVEPCTQAGNLGTGTPTQYTLQEGDVGTFFHVRVTPRSASGTPNEGVRILTAREAHPVYRTTATANTTAQVLTVGQQGYSFTPLTNVRSGKPPFVHEVESGDLPDGLELDSESGAVTGSPTTQQAAAPVKFRVKDDNDVYATTTSTVNFTVNGGAPTASNLAISGIPMVGETLTASYDYFDPDGDPEGTGDGANDTSVDWCRTGDNKCNLAGNFKSRTYVLQAGDVGKQIYFKLVPRSQYGTPNAGATYTSPTYFPDGGTVAAALTATADTTAQVLTVGQQDYSFRPLANVSGGRSPYIFEVASGSALPAGLSIDADSGEVTGEPTTTRTATDVAFQVRDANGVVVAATVSFTVNAMTATAVTTPRTFTVGVAVPAGVTVLSGVSGGASPFACEVTEDSELPEGLEVEASGATCVLKGTPTTQQSATPVTFRVKDANGVYAATTSTVNITINGRAPIVQGGSAGILIKGVPMLGQTLTAEYTYFDADGDEEGATVIQWCRPSVTCGTGLTGPSIVLNASHSGWRLEVAVTPKSKTGTPSTGTITYSTQKVDVLAALAATANEQAQVLTVGQENYSFFPLTNVTGGTRAYTWEVKTGTLPAGVVLNADTGEVSGKPTTARAAQNVTFQVKDKNNGVYAATTSTVSFTVNSTITATAITTQRTITVNTPTGGADVMNVAGGTKPWVCEDESGTLPVGLRVDPTATTCRVTGTPTVQQTAKPVTFRVKDANGVVAVNRSTVNFVIQGAAPVVSDLKINGDLTVGSTVTGTYTYTDANGDLEGDSLIEWCRWGKEPCTQTGNLGTGTPLTYKIQDGDVNAGFHFRVTPRSVAGTNPIQGTRVTSGQHTHPVTKITATAVTTEQSLIVGQAAPNFSPLTPVTGGKAPYRYEIQEGTLPTGVTLNAETGVVSGTPSAIKTAANVVFQVKDDNGVYATTVSSVRYEVSSGLSATAETTPQVLTVGQFGYEFTPLTASGGLPPYRYEVESGSLPIGLNIAPLTGVVSGTPTTARPAQNVVFRVKDESGAYAPTKSTVSFAVNAAPTATAVTTSQVLAVGEKNYSFRPLINVSGGLAPYTYTVQAGELPEGIDLDTETGEVTGIPTAQQEAKTVTFQVEDANGIVATTTSTVSFFVRAELTATANTAPQTLVVGQTSYTFQPFTGISGGFLPYTYGIQSGSLPPGMRFASGVVQDIPNAVYPAAEIVFWVRDAKGSEVTSTVIFSVWDKPTATRGPGNQVLAVGQTGYSYYGLVNVAGGLPPYTFENTGTLPVGLTLNALTGEITGSPTQVTPTTTITFRVKDANNTYAATTNAPTFRVVTPAAMTVTANTTPQSLLVQQSGYKFHPLSVAGGITPYRYEILSGTLPTSLTLDSALGFVHGTPSAAQPASNVVFQVRDGTGTYSPVTSTVSFSVKVAPIATPDTTPQVLTVGQSNYSFKPFSAVISGVTPYTYELAPGSALPTGVRLNASTGVVDGTPSATRTPSNVVFRVKDAAGVYAQATSTVSFVVNGGLTATANTAAQSLIVGQQGYSFTPLAASGGTPPYTVTVKSGSLPLGLIINPSGVVTSSPSATYAAANVEFQVRDSNGTVAPTTSTVNFTVNQGRLYFFTTAQSPFSIARTFQASTALSGSASSYARLILSNIKKDVVCPVPHHETLAIGCSLWVRITLIAPNGAQAYQRECNFTHNVAGILNCPNQTLNLSQYPRNGTWQLKIEKVKGTSGINLLGEAYLEL